VVESQWGLDFPHPASCTMGTGPFLVVKWSGHGIDCPPPSSAKVKETLSFWDLIEV